MKKLLLSICVLGLSFNSFAESFRRKNEIGRDN